MTYMVREQAGQIRNADKTQARVRRKENCQLTSRPWTPLDSEATWQPPCTCHSQGLWMVNWLPVPSNDHLVTRATTLIQWQKLFQAPEPKPNSQTVKKYMYIFFFFLSSGLICYLYSLPLLTIKIEISSHEHREWWPSPMCECISLTQCSFASHPSSPILLQPSNPVLRKPPNSSTCSSLRSTRRLEGSPKGAPSRITETEFSSK